MGIIDGITAFIGSMHISAIIIISIILTVFFLSLAFHIILRIRYGALNREITRVSSIGRGSLAGGTEADRFSAPRSRSPILRGVVSEFESAWAARRGVEVNTQAVIENYFNHRMKAARICEGFARHSVSVMIVIGLLGTFIGLTISVQSLVLLFRGYDVTELLSSVESGLLSALAGMSTAFTTSLFGIACSVIITVIGVFISPGQSRESLLVSVEEYLDNTLSARLSAAEGDGSRQMNDALRSTFIEFGERIAERFDRSLTTMREDVRGIEEVNNNLRNTIERMDVSFMRVADTIKASTRHIDDNYRAVANLSEHVDETRDEIARISKENISYTDYLVKSVAEAAQAVGELTADLRGEAQRRLDNFESYDAAISQMVKSVELIRDAVAVIPEQMYAYTEASKSAFLTRRVREAPDAAYDNAVAPNDNYTVGANDTVSGAANGGVNGRTAGAAGDEAGDGGGWSRSGR